MQCNTLEIAPVNNFFYLFHINNYLEIICTIIEICFGIHFQNNCRIALLGVIFENGNYPARLGGTDDRSLLRSRNEIVLKQGLTRHDPLGVRRCATGDLLPAAQNRPFLEKVSKNFARRRD
jgi:hypothetical protein